MNMTFQKSLMDRNGKRVEFTTIELQNLFLSLLPGLPEGFSVNVERTFIRKSYSSSLTSFDVEFNGADQKLAEAFFSKLNNELDRLITQKAIGPIKPLVAVSTVATV